MNKDLRRNGIRKSLEMLNEDEKVTVNICSVLCTEEGVCFRNLFEIIGDDSHAFRKEMKNILRSGLVVELPIYRMYCPKEVKVFLSKNAISVEVINSVIKRLQEKTQLSIDTDLLQAKPYFGMAFAIMNYMVQHHDNGIDFNIFARLLVNLVRYYEIYAKPDMSIADNKQLPIMKGIELAKSTVDNQTSLYAQLCACEAFLYLSGFYYNDAKRLIDEAFSIKSINAEALSYTHLMLALLHENNGQIGDCLVEAYKSWELAEDEVMKDHVANYVSYELALLHEFDTCQKWVEKIKMKYSRFHTISIMNDLILALRYSSNESLVEKYLMRAESYIDTINNKAALKGNYYYVKSIILSQWGFKRESNELYRMYASLIADHYKSTDGASYIHIASEVDRLTSIGALTAAKHLVNDKLDTFQIMHPGYSLSVKMDLCLSYINIYRSAGLYPLAHNYFKLGLDFAKQAIPSAETLSVIQNIFFENSVIPESLTGVGLVWRFQYENLKNMLSDKDVPILEAKLQIEHLKELFPNQKKDLELISASLLDTHSAISALYKAITHAEQSEKFHVSVQSGRIAVSLGLIFEGADFFNIMLNTEGYKNLCKYQQIDILIEVATNLENCGKRQEARLIWTQLEALSKATSKLGDVWQAWGNCSVVQEQFEEALGNFDKCLAVIRPEDSLIDQRLSSIYSFRASCYGSLRNYQAAYDNAINAKQNFPMENFDAFSLEYNLGLFALSLTKYKEARDVLTRAKTLARTEEEKESVNELLSILAMKKADREAYLKQILYNFDT